MAATAVAAAAAAQPDQGISATEHLVINTKPILHSALKSFESQLTHRGKVNAASNFTPNPPGPDALETLSRKLCELAGNEKSTEKLTRSQRRARLQSLRATADVDEARRVTSNILAEWNGCGLHVFEAIEVLGSFPSETIAAVEILFAALERLAHRWATEQDPRQIWRQLKSANGRANRYMKRADRTLTHLICRHWDRNLKAREFDTFDWSSILFRSLRTFSMLSTHMTAPTKGNKSAFEGPKQIVLQSSGVTLLAVHGVQYSRLVVQKVAGEKLPQELIDMIIDDLNTSLPSLKFCVSIASKGDRHFNFQLLANKATKAKEHA